MLMHLAISSVLVLCFLQILTTYNIEPLPPLAMQFKKLNQLFVVIINAIIRQQWLMLAD